VSSGIDTWHLLWRISLLINVNQSCHVTTELIYLFVINLATPFQ
jgi:hypothetical protein